MVFVFCEEHDGPDAESFFEADERHVVTPVGVGSDSVAQDLQIH